MKTKIIASITSWEDWLNLPPQLEHADAVELRLDALPTDVSSVDILGSFPAYPVLITPRSEEEGGLRPYSLNERVAIAFALLPRAWALDWEIQSMEEAPELLAAAKKSGVLIIASAHDFTQMPSLETLEILKAKARRLGADIVKFAFMLSSEEEMNRASQLIDDDPIAIMGMGALGPESRVLYSKQGSCLVYGYLGDSPAAPGQMPVAQLYALLA